jgi:thymidylate synthase
MTKGPLLIEDSNLSSAWAKAFLEAMEPRVEEIVPLVVTVTGLVNGRPIETPFVRKALDHELTKVRLSCDTVASTIFPQSLWNPAEERDVLFKRYISVLPRMKKVELRNKYGIYFERLIAFGKEKFNQLEHIISTYQRGNHRDSALQASTFDPLADHTHQRQRGFPCMQQVAFAPYGKDELAVIGFYAKQYLFERAYGNYLGLCNLGRFVAHELGLRLTKMTCVAGVATMGDINKRDLEGLLQELKILKSPT